MRYVCMDNQKAAHQEIRPPARDRAGPDAYRLTPRYPCGSRRGGTTGTRFRSIYKKFNLVGTLQTKFQMEPCKLDSKWNYVVGAPCALKRFPCGIRPLYPCQPGAYD